MMLADANLVLAAINPNDSQHNAARQFLAANDVRVPASVTTEILLGSRLRGECLVPVLGAMVQHFAVDDAPAFATAAELVDQSTIKGVFDAIHLAAAWHRGEPLVTNDRRLHRAGIPTVGF